MNGNYYVERAYLHLCVAQTMRDAQIILRYYQEFNQNTL